MTDTKSMLDRFSQEKKDQSPYLTLKNGESMQVLKVRSMQTLTKESFGTEKQVIRMVVDVETQNGVVQKTFDQGSIKWCDELLRNNIDVGSSFTVSRDGEGTKTRYIISDAVSAASGSPSDKGIPEKMNVDLGN